MPTVYTPPPRDIAEHSSSRSPRKNMKMSDKRGPSNPEVDSPPMGQQGGGGGGGGGDASSGVSARKKWEMNPRPRKILPGGMRYGDLPNESLARAIQLNDLRKAKEIFSACDVPLATCRSANDRPMSHIAARNGNVKALQWLSNHGEDMTERHEDLGDTALHMACWSNELHAARFICASKEAQEYANFADFRSWQDGKTAGHVAVERGHDKLVRWLFDPESSTAANAGGGCSLFVSDGNDRTPIDLIRAGFGTPNENRVTIMASETPDLRSRILAQYNDATTASTDEEEKGGGGDDGGPPWRAAAALVQPSTAALTAAGAKQQRDPHLSLRIWANVVALRTARNEEQAAAAVADLKFCVGRAGVVLMKAQASGDGPLSPVNLHRSIRRWNKPGTVMHANLARVIKSINYKSSW